MGKYDLAIQDYDAALGFNRAYAYLKSGQYEQALADYNSLVQKNPDDAEALNNRCWTFVVMHRAREGLGDCDRSLSWSRKPTLSTAGASPIFSSAILRRQSRISTRRSSSIP